MYFRSLNLIMKRKFNYLFMESNSPTKYILAIGNPIIDISANTDESTIKKYNLGFGRTVFRNEENEGIYSFLESQTDVTYIPGGSVTNSIRIANVKLIKFSGFSKTIQVIDVCC